MHDDCNDEASNDDFVTHRPGNPQNVKRGRRLQREPTQRRLLVSLDWWGVSCVRLLITILSHHHR